MEAALGDSAIRQMCYIFRADCKRNPRPFPSLKCDANEENQSACQQWGLRSIVRARCARALAARCRERWRQGFSVRDFLAARLAPLRHARRKNSWRLPPENDLDE